jgi:hypothetical protein
MPVLPAAALLIAEPQRCVRKAHRPLDESSEWYGAVSDSNRARPSSKRVSCNIVDGRKIEPAIGIYQAALQFETLIAIAWRCARIHSHC